jgi:hypothetical protein
MWLNIRCRWAGFIAALQKKDYVKVVRGHELKMNYPFEWYSRRDGVTWVAEPWGRSGE